MPKATKEELADWGESFDDNFLNRAGGIKRTPSHYTNTKISYQCFLLFREAQLRVKDLNIGEKKRFYDLKGKISSAKESLARDYSTAHVYKIITRLTEGYGESYKDLSDVKVKEKGYQNQTLRILSHLTISKRTVNVMAVSIAVGIATHGVVPACLAASVFGVMFFSLIKKYMISIAMSTIYYRYKVHNRENRHWIRAMGADQKGNWVIQRGIDDDVKKWASGWGFNVSDGMQRLYRHCDEISQLTIFQAYYDLVEKDLKNKKDPSEFFLDYGKADQEALYGSISNITCDAIKDIRGEHILFLHCLTRFENYFQVLLDTITISTQRLKALEQFNFKYSKIVSSAAWEWFASANDHSSCKERCYTSEKYLMKNFNLTTTAIRDFSGCGWAKDLTNLDLSSIQKLTNYTINFALHRENMSVADFLRSEINTDELFQGKVGEEKEPDEKMQNISLKREFLKDLRIKIFASEIKHDFIHRFHVSTELEAQQDRNPVERRIREILIKEANEIDASNEKYGSGLGPSSAMITQERKRLSNPIGPWLFSYISKYAEISGIIYTDIIYKSSSKKVSFWGEGGERQVPIDDVYKAYFNQLAGDCFSSEVSTPKSVKNVKLALKNSLNRIKLTKKQIINEAVSSAFSIPIMFISPFVPSLSELDLSHLTNDIYGINNAFVKNIKKFDGSLFMHTLVDEEKKEITNHLFSSMEEDIEKSAAEIKIKAPSEIEISKSLMQKENQELDKEVSKFLSKEIRDKLKNCKPSFTSLKEVHSRAELFENENAVVFGELLLTVVNEINESFALLNKMGVSEDMLIFKEGQIPEFKLLEISVGNCLDVYNVTKDFLFFQKKLSKVYAHIISAQYFLGSICSLYEIFSRIGVKVRHDFGVFSVRDFHAMKSHSLCKKGKCYAERAVLGASTKS